ncbi:MAG: hypothetical protein LCH38_14410 [Proteobacteria bacterium]|nr:hypothetical protein [Pseudomonadota bacterium]
MHFHFDHVTRDTIAGWLTPDNPSHIPTFRVEIDGREFRSVEAAIWRPDLVEARLHDTGQVGFRFDDSTVPGLSTASEVTIAERKGNRLIYRRSEAKNFIEGRFFLFNNLPIFSRPIRAALADRFLLSYAMIENAGLETAFALLGNNAVNSVAAEGRLAVGPYIEFFRRFHYHLSALLIDPFEELANRLLFVRAVTMAANAPPLSVLPPQYSNIGGLAGRLEQATRRQIAHAFQNLTEAELSVIRDPITRMLGCAPGEIAEPRHVPVALALLAEFNSVGVFSQPEVFRRTVAMQIDLNFESLAFFAIPEALPLAAALREDPQVNRLLTNDARVFRHVAESIDRAINTGEGDNELRDVLREIRRG